MPTPVTAFADAARKYGDVDPQDIEAVQHWFAAELPKLPHSIIEEVLEDLLAQDGGALGQDVTPSYPPRAPLPTLRASPSVASPLWAGPWLGVIRRLLGFDRKR